MPLLELGLLLGLLQMLLLTLLQTSGCRGKEKEKAKEKKATSNRALVLQPPPRVGRSARSTGLLPLPLLPLLPQLQLQLLPLPRTALAPAGAKRLRGWRPLRR